MSTELELRILSAPEIRVARHAIRDALVDRGFDERDVWVLELVVGELLGAAYDANVTSSVLVTIDTFTLLHTVRLTGIRPVQVSDAPFHLRERVLHGATLAFGQRRNADGTTDLWAEVPRSDHARSTSNL